MQLNTLYLKLHFSSSLILALFSPFAVISPGGRGQFSQVFLHCSSSCLCHCVFSHSWLISLSFCVSLSLLLHPSFFYFKSPSTLIRTINVLIKLGGKGRALIKRAICLTYRLISIQMYIPSIYTHLSVLWLTQLIIMLQD